MNIFEGYDSQGFDKTGLLHDLIKTFSLFVFALSFDTHMRHTSRSVAIV